MHVYMICSWVFVVPSEFIALLLLMDAVQLNAMLGVVCLGLLSHGK